MRKLLLALLVSSAFAQMPVIPLPNPLPQMGYAGATFSDPRYGTTITQCTDQTTDPQNARHYSFEVTDSGGNSDAQWSYDGTMLRVVKADTGTTEVVSWDGSTCKLIPGSELPTGASFSTVAHKQYYPKGTQIWQQDLSVSPPQTSMLTDLAACLPAGFKETWHSPVTTMDGDEAFAISFSDQGAQDTGEYVVLWTQKGCHVFNTAASTIDGKSVSAPSFRVHDTFVSPAGWVIIGVGPGTCPQCPAVHGPFVWLANSSVVNLVTQNAGGHGAAGNMNLLNLVDAPRMADRLYPYVGTVSFLLSGTGISYPQPQDTHCGWQAGDPLDLNPFWCSQMSIPAKSGTTPEPISQPLQDELYTVDPVTQMITRQGHCFSSGVANSFNFRSQYCIGAESPDGKWIAFSSDWMGNLGNTQNLGPGPTLWQRLTGSYRPTPQPCTLGAGKPNECQSQVFILQVKK